MVNYVMTDIRPFIVLGTLMVVTFGATFRVLFADIEDKDEGERFSTLWLAFESMFHATLGNFDAEVSHREEVSFTDAVLTAGPLCITHQVVSLLEISSLQSVSVSVLHRSSQSLDRGA